MPDTHAVLSPSSSARWLACTPSARLCVAKEDKTSEYAIQGTSAHALAEYKLKKSLGQPTEDPKENLTYFDKEMDDCTDSYQQYVIEKLTEIKQLCKDPVVLVEQKLDFSKYVPDSFGTADCVIVADDTLTVIDLKYGVGILVDAEQNTQMMLYALGALIMFDGIYDIETVTMTIFQPRRDNVSTFSMRKSELIDWAENVLKPKAELAYKGEGEFNAGSHCQFCKVKATCRKRAEYNLELAKYDFEMPDSLEDDEIEIILSKADEFISWLGDVKEYALNQALQGKLWKEYKLVEGRSNRKYKNESAAAKIVEAAGFDPYEHKVLGITAMQKMLGRTKFNELLGDFIEKPQGKPTLVPISDKRPTMKNTAKEDFKEEI